MRFYSISKSYIIIKFSSEINKLLCLSLIFLNLKLEIQCIRYIFIYRDVLDTVVMIHDAKKIFQDT